MNKIVQIRSEDIVVKAFTPSDGSVSAAIKVVHRPSGKEAVNSSTDSQRANLRNAILDLIMSLNPAPDQIRPPSLLPFDHVRVNLVSTFHDGEITDLTWDFPRTEWKYFVECSEQKVTNRYVDADLQLLED